jgi:hypothetical protein
MSTVCGGSGGTAFDKRASWSRRCGHGEEKELRIVGMAPTGLLCPVALLRSFRHAVVSLPRNATLSLSGDAFTPLRHCACPCAHMVRFGVAPQRKSLAKK